MRLKILFALFALVAILSPTLAQTDSVCASNPVANYHVNGSAGSSFLWNTQGNGTILSGQGNDSVMIQWTNVPGMYSISVRETNANGCEGALQILNVVIYQLGSTNNVQICPGSNYVLPTGTSVNTAGTYAVSLPGSNGCDSIVTTVLTINNAGSSVTDITICPSELPYVWNGNSYNSGGDYSVILTGSSGCDSVATLTLAIDQNPVNPIFRDSNLLLCPGDSIILTPGIFNSYLWQDFSTGPGYIVTQDGTYSVEVANAAGCTARATAIVRYATTCDDIYFPNAISPNADGLNDKFGPLGNLSFVSNYTLSIYNRYGELVFTSGNPYKKWDGYLKEVQQANINFVWFASYRFKGNLLKIKKGNLMVIR